MAARKKKKKPVPPVVPVLAKYEHLLTPGFYVLTVLLCFFVYRGIADNYLFNDDLLWMSKARHEMALGNLLTFRVIGFFRPVINVSYYLTERVAPGNIPLYYYTNLLVHWLNTILVFHLVRLLFRHRGVAMATAVYFLVVSSHSGAVVWLSARTTLVCSFFLLSSLVLLAGPRAGRKRLAASLVLYVLALSSKETAAVGLLLVGLSYLVFRKGGRTSFGLTSVISFAAVTIVYLVARKLVMGGFVQANWGPGMHILTNVGGGMLYQFFPWGLAALSGKLPAFQVSTHPVWPEILALPLAALLIGAGWKWKKRSEMVFAVAWVAICLLPSSLFKFRFFSTVSIPHERYYYLSSIGMCLAVVSLLAILWDSSRVRVVSRAAAAAALILVCLGEVVCVKYTEKKWEVATNEYRDFFSRVERVLDQYDRFSTVAIEDPPIPYVFTRAALSLERPRWRVERASGGPEGALEHQPCLFMQFVRNNGTFRMELYTMD